MNCISQPALRIGFLIGLAAASGCGETAFTNFKRDADGPPLSVSYLVEGGAVDELQSLVLAIQDIRLLEAQDVAVGTQGIGSLPEPVEVEWLGLENRGRLLTTRYYGDGVFTHVRVDFAAAHPTARRHGGEPVVWSGDGALSVLVELDAPLVATREAPVAERMVLQLDPAESIVSDDGLPPLAGAPTGGGAMLAFEPVIRARTLASGERLRADDLWGGLLAVSGDGRVVTVSSEAERTIADRPVLADVLLEDTTLLLQPDGVPIPGLGGLSLQPGLDVARFLVRGSYTSGGPGFQAQMLATSVQLDSLLPGHESDAAFVLESRIVGRSAGGDLTVRPIEIERGGAAIRATLDALGDPETIMVHVGPLSTVLTEEDELGTGDSLRVGTRVKLHFASFITEPFEATRAVMQGRPAHRGVLLDRPAGSSQLFLQIDADAAAMAGGLVASTETPVAVSPSSLFARLDVEGTPLLLVDELPSGLRTVVRGRITGQPTLPIILQSEIVIRPGRFRGSMTGVHDQGSAFDASVLSIDAPFGGEVDSPPFLVRIASPCVFEGEATDREAFLLGFETLEPGERLDVEVSGIAGDEPNEVLAYQIRSWTR